MRDVLESLKNLPDMFISNYFIRFFVRVLIYCLTCNNTFLFSSALNRNSNGTLSFSDFLVFYSISSFGNLKEKIKLAFKVYDHNKDNVIDKSEMRQMLEILFDLTMIGQAEGKKKTAQSTVKIIMKKLDKIDTNRDKLIQFDEFMNACINDKMICSILVDPMFNC